MFEKSEKEEKMKNLLTNQWVLMLTGLVLVIITACLLIISGPTVTVPKGRYAVLVRFGQGYQIIPDGEFRLFPWESLSQVRDMGTVNTIVGLASGRRRFVIEGQSLTAKTSIPYYPAEMVTADGTPVTVFYNWYTQRDPAKLLLLFNTMSELSAVVELDSWIELEVGKLSDLEVADSENRGALLKKLRSVIDPKLESKGLLTLDAEFHIQFVKQ